MPVKQIESSLAAPAGVSQPGVKDGVQKTTRLLSQASARLIGTDATADVILENMRSWYEDFVGDEDVSHTWKHLHSVLFKKVKRRNAADMWCNPGDSENGIPIVVSKEYVAFQVKKVIERREEWLRDNGLPLARQ